MQRIVIVLSLAIALGGALGATARAAQEATPAATPTAADVLFPEAIDLPELEISTTEDSFEGVPEEVAAGRYLVTFTNGSTDESGVEFVQLAEGLAFERWLADWEDFRATLAAGEASPAAASPAAAENENFPLDHPPDSYFEVYQAGGPFAAFPGQTVQGIVELPAGDYVVWNDNPFLPQRPVSLRVTGDLPAAAPLPPADVTIRHGETASGHAMAIEGELRPGPQMVEFVNEGDQTHYAWFGRAPGPITAEQVVRALDVPEGGTPPADAGFDPEELVFVALTQTQSAGTTQWMALDLEPGTYVVACFAFDPTDDYRVHAFEGELEVVTVGEASASAP